MKAFSSNDKNMIHAELDQILEIMSHFDSADDAGKHHIADKVFGFLETLAGPLIEEQLHKEGRTSFRAKAFHLDEPERPDNWPTSVEEHRSYRARVLIALVGFLRVSLKNIGFPVAGVNRDLLASTCDHKYTPQYLPICQRGAGKDDNDDRRIMARRKFTLGVYAEKWLSKKSIQEILAEYQGRGIHIMEDTWKNLRKEVSVDARRAVKETGEDDTDYSGYELPEDLVDLFHVAVRPK